MAESSSLQQLAQSFTAPMTSIRGRRIYRVLVREFAAAQCVVPALDADARPAVLGFWSTGALAVLRTDGRGETVTVQWCRLDAGAVDRHHDLLRDSLPIVGITLNHPAMTGLPVSIRKGDVAPEDWPGLVELVATVMQRHNCAT